MPAKHCAICNAIIKGPVVVIEVSALERGRSRLDRAIACESCGAWVRTFARTQPVVEPGESAAIPDDPPLRVVRR